MANLPCPWELKSFCGTRSMFHGKEYLCTVEPSFTTFFEDYKRRNNYGMWESQGKGSRGITQP